MLYDQFIKVTIDKADQIDKICCTTNLLELLWTKMTKLIKYAVRQIYKSYYGQN